MDAIASEGPAQRYLTLSCLLTAPSPVTSQPADGAMFTNTEAAWEVTCGAWSDGVLTPLTRAAGVGGREVVGGEWGGGWTGGRGSGEEGSAESYKVV